MLEMIVGIPKLLMFWTRTKGNTVRRISPSGVPRVGTLAAQGAQQITHAYTEGAVLGYPAVCTKRRRSPNNIISISKVVANDERKAGYTANAGTRPSISWVWADGVNGSSMDPAFLETSWVAGLAIKIIHVAPLHAPPSQENGSSHGDRECLIGGGGDLGAARCDPLSWWKELRVGEGWHRGADVLHSQLGYVRD
ncbi:hypothetical protein B0H14DRAFT_2560571 [Mycena olivaceomarginata]|nr:hypothetical protein B0H14DRAFT_2560571 [Mycena olivaceomarginata]